LKYARQNTQSCKEDPNDSIDKGTTKIFINVFVSVSMIFQNCFVKKEKKRKEKEEKKTEKNVFVQRETERFAFLFSFEFIVGIENLRFLG